MRCPRFDVVCWICVTTMVISFVAGCTTTISPQEISSSTAPVPAVFPESYYRQAQALGKKVLQINPERSLVTIEVRRAGTLARLGHDHVVASHDIHGYVAPDEGRADLSIPLAKLTIDEPKLRAEVGFDTQPTAEAIEGTRNNMLTKVLEVERYPLALIHITRIDPALTTLRVSITLHGSTRTFEVPVKIEMLATGMLVRGSVSFTQSEFGMVPYSVLGGAIQVQDRLDLQFRIEANEL
jgi:hypothetical protein